MVRVNLVEPSCLADQHLIAEYNEILMLLGYVRKHKGLEKSIPRKYVLGKGHILFFKDKLVYLKRRHESLRREMCVRGFVTEKSINLSEFPRKLRNDWKPKEEDLKIIKQRIITKIKLKPGYYRYYGERKPKDFFIELISEAKSFP